jgi:hypothetical protein
MRNFALIHVRFYIVGALTVTELERKDVFNVNSFTIRINNFSEKKDSTKYYQEFACQ